MASASPVRLATPRSKAELREALDDLSAQAASVSDEELRAHLYRQKLRYAMQVLEEQEVARRLDIVRAQHDAFLRTAERYVGLLFRSAEHSTAALEALSWGSPRYEELSIRRARSAPPGGSASPERGDGRPNRLLVTSASNAGGPVHVTQVKLTGAPQRHQREVAERRLDREEQELKERLETFRRHEERRRESYLRRGAMLMAKAPEKPRAGVDRAAVLARREQEQLEKREVIRRKHDRLEERRRALALRDRATGDALRYVDRLAAARISERAEQQRQVERQVTQATHRVAGKTQQFREHVDAEARVMHQRRQRAKADFQHVFHEATSGITKRLQRREHEAVGLHAKAVADSMAVDITWPAELSKAAPKPKPTAISDDRYARLCGFKHSFTATHRTDISVADIVAARHVPPSAWGLLHAVDPDAAALTLEAAQANVLRGPQSVTWR